MPTPLLIRDGITEYTGSKVVFALRLPTGKVTGAATTVAGGTVPGTTAVPAGASFVYVGLDESPAGSGHFEAAATLAGTLLPDTEGEPYTGQARTVDDATDMADYAAMAAAFAASTTVIASGVVGSTAGGWLKGGVWGSDVAVSDASAEAIAEAVDVSGALASAGTTINILNPTDADGNTTIVQGDDYTDNEIADRRLMYTFTGFTGDVTGATVEWKLTPKAAYDKNNRAPAELTITTGATATLDGSTLTVKVPLTHEQTDALKHVSRTDSEVAYRVQVALLDADGKRMTQLLADGVVLKKVGA